MKNNTKRISSILLVITLTIAVFFSCVFTSSAADGSDLFYDRSSVMTASSGDDHGVTFSSEVNYAANSLTNYSMEVIWAEMALKYEYLYEDGKWSGKWSDNSFDGINNKITVINNSQVPIFGTISYDSSTEYFIEEGLDLGITLNTKNEIEPNGATVAEVKLDSNKHQDYYLYSNADLAFQAQQSGVVPTEYQSAKAGIVKVVVAPDTTEL